MLTSIQLLDKISVGSIVIDSQYNVLIWNQVMENWTGVKKDEIIGTKITDKYQQFRQLEIQTRLQSVFTYGTPVVFSSQIHKYLIYCELPNNRFRYQQTMVTAIQSDENPQEFYALFSIQDVTDITEKIAKYKEVVKLANDRNVQLEKSREQLLASELNLRNMVEFSKDAITIMQENQFKFYNSSLLQMLDIDEERMKSLNFENIQTGKILKYEKLWEELQKNDSVNFDIKFRKGKDEEIYVNSIFKETVYENSKSIIAIFRDITNHMEILEALRQDLKDTAEKGEILTICSSCHKIKDTHEDEKKWMKLEKYLAKYITKTDISHGLCDVCFEKYYPKEYEKYKVHLDSVVEKKKK